MVRSGKLDSLSVFLVIADDCISSDGAVGKHFNADGTIGGAVQDNLGGGKK